jgi:hypothetical protein
MASIIARAARIGVQGSFVMEMSLLIAGYFEGTSDLLGN